MLLYIEDKLGSHEDNRDATGLLTFEYFLKKLNDKLLFFKNKIASRLKIIPSNAK